MRTSLFSIDKSTESNRDNKFSHSCLFNVLLFCFCAAGKGLSVPETLLWVELFFWLEIFPLALFTGLVCWELDSEYSTVQWLSVLTVLP